MGGGGMVTVWWGGGVFGCVGMGVVGGVWYGRSNLVLWTGMEN